jgi:hypothetical protein
VVASPAGGPSLYAEEGIYGLSALIEILITSRLLAAESTKALAAQGPVPQGNGR